MTIHPTYQVRDAPTEQGDATPKQTKDLLVKCPNCGGMLVQQTGHPVMYTSVSALCPACGWTWPTEKD